MSQQPHPGPGGSGPGEEGRQGQPPGPAGQPPPPQYPPNQYPPAPPPPPGYRYPLERQPQNGFGLTAMVTGIVGLAVFWLPVANLVLGVVAVVFGVLGVRRVRAGQATNQGQAVAGLVTGLVAVALAVTLLLLAVASDSSHYYFS